MKGGTTLAEARSASEFRNQPKKENAAANRGVEKSEPGSA
jgi:hypothetical protein